MAHDDSAEARSRLLGIISEIFDEQEDTLSGRERVLIYGILHHVVQDVEMTVRKNLSTKLASMDDVPIELIRELANDQIEVAFPILSKSTILRDEDLIQVIRMRSHTLQAGTAQLDV